TDFIFCFQTGLDRCLRIALRDFWSPLANNRDWRRMMKVECRRLWGVLAISQLAWSLASPTAHATAAASATKAKHEAETQGYAFALRHNDIVSKAKREGRLRVITSLEDDKLKPVAEAFRKKYPFIELRAEEIGGTDTYKRLLLEMKGGAARGGTI